ncbi:hypothetical protein STEG23_005439, partial [Scotinomys teguina]
VAVQDCIPTSSGGVFTLLHILSNVLNAMNFPLSTTFIVSHKCRFGLFMVSQISWMFCIKNLLDLTFSLTDEAISCIMELRLALLPIGADIEEPKYAFSDTLNFHTVALKPPSPSHVYCPPSKHPVSSSSR